LSAGAGVAFFPDFLATPVSLPDGYFYWGIFGMVPLKEFESFFTFYGKPDGMFPGLCI